MSRLYRGRWQVLANHGDHLEIEPQTVSLEYHDAEILMSLLDDSVRSARLIRVPDSRAPWEYKAPWEATDPPNWENGYG